MFILKDWRFISAAILLITGAGMGVSLRHAHKELEGLETEARAGLAALASNRSSILDKTGEPKPALESSAVEAYVTSFERKAPQLRELARRLAPEGAVAWFADRRFAMADEIQQHLREELEVVAAAKLATRSVAALRPKTDQALLTAGERRDRAIRALVPESDVDDFENQERSLEEAVNSTDAVRDELSRERDATETGELPGKLRVSLLRALDAPLASEAQRLRALSAEVTQGRRALARHKEDMLQLVSDRTGMIRAVYVWSGHLDGPVDWLSDRCVDIKPILWNLESSTWVRSFERVRSGVEGLVENVEAACEAVDWAEELVWEAHQATRDVVLAMAIFETLEDRTSQLQVFAAAPQAAVFFENKRGFFNPAILKVEEVGYYVDSVRGSVYSIVPFRWLRNLLLKGVEKVEGLVYQAKFALIQGNVAIVNTASVLRELERKEHAYVRTLRSLTGRG